MKITLRFLYLTIVGVFMAWGAAAAAPLARPHVIFILADDMAGDAAGFFSCLAVWITRLRI